MASKFELKLLRATNPALLPSIDDIDIIGAPVFTRPTFVKTINEIKVQYSKREEGAIPTRVMSVGVDVDGETYWAFMSDGYAYAIGWDTYDWGAYGMDNPVVSVHPEGLQFMWAATWEEGLLAIDQNGLLWAIGYVTGFTGTPEEDHSPDNVGDVAAAARAVVFAFPAQGVSPVLSTLGRTYNAAGGLGYDGKAWTWGSNYGQNGELGIGSVANLWQPTPIEVIPVIGDNLGWTCLAAGWSHFAGIRNGEILTWGHNGDGCLGMGIDYFLNDYTYRQQTKWTLSSHGTGEYYMEKWGGGDPQCVFPTHVYQYNYAGFTGHYTKGSLGSLAQSEWNWGNNDGLGYNTIYIRMSNSADPIAASWSTLRGRWTAPQRIYAGGSDWVKVDCGSYSTVALKSDGTLWGFGTNYEGSLGHEPGTCDDAYYVGSYACYHANPIDMTPPGKTIVDFSAGWYHTVALEADGTAWVVGWNGYYGEGTLGLGIDGVASVYEWTEITTTKFSVVDCSADASIGIGLDGKIYIWGELWAPNGDEYFTVPTVWDFGEYWAE